MAFEYIETICKMKNVEIVIMQEGQDKKSIQEELAEDIKVQDLFNIG